MTDNQIKPSLIKPYLLRALYEWCTDNGFTPYLSIVVNAKTRVPMQFVKDQAIVLNISREATHGLKFENDVIEFRARFNGVSHVISIPVDNVDGIYAQENGQGMAFEVTDDIKTDNVPSMPKAPSLAAVPASAGHDDDTPPTPSSKNSKRPSLTRIK